MPTRTSRRRSVRAGGGNPATVARPMSAMRRRRRSARGISRARHPRAERRTREVPLVAVPVPRAAAPVHRAAAPVTRAAVPDPQAADRAPRVDLGAVRRAGGEPGPEAARARQRSSEARNDSCSHTCGRQGGRAAGVRVQSRRTSSAHRGDDRRGRRGGADLSTIAQRLRAGPSSPGRNGSAVTVVRGAPALLWS